MIKTVYSILVLGAEGWRLKGYFEYSQMRIILFPSVSKAICPRTNCISAAREAEVQTASTGRICLVILWIWRQIFYSQILFLLRNTCHSKKLEQNCFGNPCSKGLALNLVENLQIWITTSKKIYYLLSIESYLDDNMLDATHNIQ